MRSVLRLAVAATALCSALLMPIAEVSADSVSEPIADTISAQLKDTHLFIDPSLNQDVFSHDPNFARRWEWTTMPVGDVLDQYLPFVNIVALGGNFADAFPDLAREIAARVGRPGIYFVLGCGYGGDYGYSTDPALQGEVDEFMDVFGSCESGTSDLLAGLLENREKFSNCDFNAPRSIAPLKAKWADRKGAALTRNLDLSSFASEYVTPDEIYFPDIAIAEDCKRHTAALSVRRDGRWVTVDKVTFERAAALPNYMKACETICNGTYDFQLTVDKNKPEAFRIKMKPALNVFIGAPTEVAPYSKFTASLSVLSGRPAKCSIRVRKLDYSGRVWDSFDRYMNSKQTFITTKLTISAYDVGSVSIGMRCTTSKQTDVTNVTVKVTTGA